MKLGMTILDIIQLILPITSLWSSSLDSSSESESDCWAGALFDGEEGVGGAGASGAGASGAGSLCWRGK